MHELKYVKHENGYLGYTTINIPIVADANTLDETVKEARELYIMALKYELDKMEYSDISNSFELVNQPEEEYKEELNLNSKSIKGIEILLKEIQQIKSRIEHGDGLLSDYKFVDRIFKTIDIDLDPKLDELCFDNIDHFFRSQLSSDREKQLNCSAFAGCVIGSIEALEDFLQKSLDKI